MQFEPTCTFYWKLSLQKNFCDKAQNNRIQNKLADLERAFFTWKVSIDLRRFHYYLKCYILRRLYLPLRDLVSLFRQLYLIFCREVTINQWIHFDSRKRKMAVNNEFGQERIRNIHPLIAEAIQQGCVDHVGDNGNVPLNIFRSYGYTGITKDAQKRVWPLTARQGRVGYFWHAEQCLTSTKMRYIVCESQELRGRRCGLQGHFVRDPECKARLATCMKFQILGHFAKVC